MTVRRSMLRKYATYFVALVAVSLIASALVGLHYTYQESKEGRLRLQHEKAQAAALRIEGFVKGIEREIGWLRAPRLSSQRIEALQREYQKLLRLEPSITDLRLLDSDGAEQLLVSRIRMSRTASGEDFSADPRFRNARAATYFSPVTFREETEPYLSIAVPGLTQEGGVTVADVNLKFVREVVTAARLSPRGETYIVARNATLIAHPDMSLVLRKSDLSSLAQVRAAIFAGNGESAAVMTAKNLAGRDVLVASAPIHTLDWHVLVEEPIEEAFGPLVASLYRTALLLLAGLALSLVLGLVFARRLVTPIRALQRGAARVAAGDLDQRIEVHSGDELQTLADEFNEMARRLRESYSSLEGKVEERTRELSAALEQQTHTSEVLKTISRSSFDLDRVLSEVVKSVVKLGRADGAGLFVRRNDASYELIATYSEDPAIDRFIDRHRDRIGPHAGTASERAIALGQPFQIESTRDAPDYPWRDAGYQTVLAVPVVREAVPVGVVVAVRIEARAFSESEVGMAVTFADQAGIALENNRLFSEIRETSRALELANRHKSEFLANVSHELRTPLNAIIGFSEALRAGMFGQVTPKQAEHLDDIYQSGRHLLALINDILDLSKIDAGHAELNLSIFDLDDALVSATNVLSEAARTGGIALEIAPHPPLGDWLADERLFRQIMLNLLSNAVKYTPCGGRVEVLARRVGDAIEIVVADTGRGIAEADLELVFDAFRQARSTDDQVEGTGLGLALTRKFVELHGGEICARSTLGAGSTFTFVLPALQPETS